MIPTEAPDPHSVALTDSLFALRRTALRGLFRRVGYSLDDVRAEEALRNRSFTDAIESVNAQMPWYLDRYIRVRWWITKPR